MIKIFRGGRGGDTFKTPSPYEQRLPLPTPYFKMFLERSLNDLPPPPPHFKHLSLLPPPHPPPLSPPPLKILIIHSSILFMVVFKSTELLQKSSERLAATLASKVILLPKCFCSQDFMQFFSPIFVGIYIT